MPQSPERSLNVAPPPAEGRASAESAESDEQPPPLPPGYLASGAQVRRLRDFDGPISRTLPGDPPPRPSDLPDDDALNAGGGPEKGTSTTTDVEQFVASIN